jgi:hypothetical protein
MAFFNFFLIFWLNEIKINYKDNLGAFRDRVGSNLMNSVVHSNHLELRCILSIYFKAEQHQEVHLKAT